MSIKNRYIDLLNFALLILLVIFTQYFLLKPVLGQGLTHDDLEVFYSAKLWGEKIISDPINTYIHFGPHYAYQEFYTFFLDFLFGSNFDYYLLFGIFLKVLATLSLYPLILLLFKRRSLAFLTTFLYGVSYASAGSLWYYTLGVEYLSIAFMNLFLISYYYFVKKMTILLAFLTPFLLIITFITSPVRVFPIIAIIFFIESFLLIKKRFSVIGTNLLRVILLFLPLVMIIVPFVGFIGIREAYSLDKGSSFITAIASGNWFLLINPLAGLGHMFLSLPKLLVFGQLDIANFPSYLSFILLGPFFIFGIAALILSFIFSKKPFRFFVKLIFINFLLEIFLFFLATYHFSISTKLLTGYDPYVFFYFIYAALVALFIVSISTVCFLEWRNYFRKDQHLLISFISIIFSFVFIIGSWLFSRESYMHQGGIHRYLVIPQLGVSLFIANIFVAVLQKSKAGLKVFTSLLISLVFIYIFIMSKDEIARGFNFKKVNGENLEAQILMQDQILKDIPTNKFSEDIIFFIRHPDEQASLDPSINPWIRAFDLGNMTTRMLLIKSYKTGKKLDGCIAVVWDEQILREMFTVQESIKGFLYKEGSNKQARCVKKGKGIGSDGVFYTLDNFYAFAIESTSLSNITEEMKSQF